MRYSTDVFSVFVSITMNSFLRKHLLVFALVLAISICPVQCLSSQSNWRMSIDLNLPIGGYWWGVSAIVGASPSSVDGYDGQQPYDPTVRSGTGCATMLYRENGPSWSGPTGFYYMDLTSPIPSGGSYTWDNIYLWAQNYNVQGGVGQLSIMPDYPEAPSYYNFQLVLDYVPEYMNWTGPTVYEFRIGALLNVPIPTVTNPLDGVRMHLTVYAGPIPEPTTLLPLAGAALAFGALWRRRRWK